MNQQFVRKNLQLVKENESKRFNDPITIDQIIELDRKWVVALYQYDQTTKLQTKLSKLIKDAPKEGVKVDENLDDFLEKKDEYDWSKLQKSELVRICTLLKPKVKSFSEETKQYKEQCEHLVTKLGNMLHKSVPTAEDEEDNQIVLTHEGHVPIAPHLGHVDMCERLGIVDFERGRLIAGHRGYFLRGWGVKLNRALIHYAQDYLEARGFELMTTPHFVLDKHMANICQLSDFEETLYKVNDKYLAATSEQPITAYFENSQPGTRLIAGLSTCYRKEAGSHGKDTLGMFRVHQFEKVEQFAVAPADESWDVFDKLITNCIGFYDSLGISYRIVNIVSGALNNAAAKKMDLEAFFPNSRTYKELVSCSNTTDYFSKKLLIKDKHHEPMHLLNSTLCANTRTLCCLMETYQTDTGMDIPKVLQPYLGGIEHIDFV